VKWRSHFKGDAVRGCAALHAVTRVVTLMVIVWVDIYRLSPNGMVRASPHAARDSDEERRSTLSELLPGSDGMAVPSDKWFDALLAKAGWVVERTQARRARVYR
jgi:transposase